MTDYLTEAQYYRTAFLGIILFMGIVFGFPILASYIGVDAILVIVGVLSIGCLTVLAYLRIDKVLIALFSD